MKANSVLVNAAFKLGESYTPGDHAKIFNKQYEGLIELNKQTGLAAEKVTQALVNREVNRKANKQLQIQKDDELIASGIE